MVYAPEPERWVHGDWRRDELDLPSWTWRHVTSSQGERLKPMTMYRVLLGRSGLPGPTRAVLRFLSDLSDYRAHAYVRVPLIAQRTGFSRRAVTDALRRAQDAGWLHIDRRNCRTGLPADYWLDVPDLPDCPCGDEGCKPSETQAVADAFPEDTAAASDAHPPGQPADAAALRPDPRQETPGGQAGDAWGSGSRRTTPRQETRDSTWVTHLEDSHLEDSHLRPASQDVDKDLRFQRWKDHFQHRGSTPEEAELQAAEQLGEIQQNERIKAGAA